MQNAAQLIIKIESLPAPSHPIAAAAAAAAVVWIRLFFLLNPPNSCTSAHIDVTVAKKLLTVCRRSSKNVRCLVLSPCAMMKRDEKQLMMRRTKTGRTLRARTYTTQSAQLCPTF